MLSSNTAPSEIFIKPPEPRLESGAAGSGSKFANHCAMLPLPPSSTFLNHPLVKDYPETRTKFLQNCTGFWKHIQYVLDLFCSSRLDAWLILEWPRVWATQQCRSAKTSVKRRFDLQWLVQHDQRRDDSLWKIRRGLRRGKYLTRCLIDLKELRCSSGESKFWLFIHFRYYCRIA